MNLLWAGAIIKAGTARTFVWHWAIISCPAFIAEAAEESATGSDIINFSTEFGWRLTSWNAGAAIKAGR